MMESSKIENADNENEHPQSRVMTAVDSSREDKDHAKTRHAERHLISLSNKASALDARRSFAITKSVFAREKSTMKLRNRVLEIIAMNRKIGPFKATSGMVLEYYLNLATNFLDKRVALLIVHLLNFALRSKVLPEIRSEGESCVLCGVEMAGGVMVGQLASSPQADSLDCEFVYVRKARKLTGTMQQLEGPKVLTNRNPSSPPMNGIILDDCLSSGQSAADLVKVLKRDYNINVVAMLFLVDRHVDRRSLQDERLDSIFSQVSGVRIYSIYDMDDISHAIKVDKSDRASYSE